jgi:hypothetical protein
MTVRQQAALKKAQAVSAEVRHARAKGGKASAVTFNKAIMHGHAKLSRMAVVSLKMRIKRDAAKAKLWSKLREQ